LSFVIWAIQSMLNCDQLLAPLQVGLPAPFESRNGLAYHLVIQPPNMPAQFRQTQPSSALAQPERSVAAPVAMPLGELVPALPFDLLQSGHDLLPACRVRGSAQRLLLPRISACALPQILREAGRPQHHSADQPGPWRFEDALPRRPFGVFPQGRQAFLLGVATAQARQRFAPNPIQWLRPKRRPNSLSSSRKWNRSESSQKMALCLLPRAVTWYRPPQPYCFPQTCSDPEF
jgi:hypothetical protein